MVDVEELMSKIKSGVTQDAFDCIKDLEQEYLQSSKTKEWREDYSLAVYFTSYGIFACSYRECVFPMINFARSCWRTVLIRQIRHCIIWRLCVFIS